MISVFRLHIHWPVALLAIADLLVLLLSAYLGISIRSSVTLTSLSIQEGPLSEFFTPRPDQIAQIAAYAVVCLVALFMLGAYRRPSLISLRDATPPILLAHGLAFMMLTVLFYVLQPTRIFLLALIPALVFSLLLVTFNRYLFKKHVAYQRFRRRVIVLGTGPAAGNIAQLMEAGRTPMVHCLGFIPSGSGPPSIQENQILDCGESLADFAQKNAVDEIVVALEEMRKNLPIPELLKCRLHGILVTNLSTFLEREEGRVELESVQPSWMIFAPGFVAGRRMQRIIKRAFDVVVSLIGLILGLPSMAIAAVAIFVEDSGPILYKQTRVGLKGRPFELIKLRTMRTDSEADGVPQWSQAHDPRITRVGKLLRRIRIDEIPQLYNVLRGEMSFIGPRPERPEFVDILEQEILYYDYRHTVKPGVSGWAQINYRYGSSVEDAKRKLEYDLYYIKNYSLFLDIIVLLQTIRVIIRPELAQYDLRSQHKLTLKPASVMYHPDDPV